MSTFPFEVRVAAFGIVLAVQPARDQISSIEIERAPDSSGEPIESDAVTVAVLPSGRRTFADIIGGEGPYHYRARSVRFGANESAWTPWVAARPTLIPAELPNMPQTAEVTGCEISFDAFGEVVVTVTGDADTTDLYVTVGDG